MTRPRTQRALVASVGCGLLALLTVPLLALVTTTTAEDLRAGLGHPLVGPALRLSLWTTCTSILVVVGLGTPLAWTLARSPGRIARLVETAVQLPIVVPPAVAGVALLLAFGRRGVLAGIAYPEGASLAFTSAAVIFAQVFVSAPFYVQAATSAFRRLDPGVILVARSLGVGPVRLLARIGLPLAAPGLVAGAAMSWARALGEFGATLMFAGNLSGRTQTLPLAIYAALEADIQVARALSVVLVAVAFGLLLLVRGLMRGATARGEPGW